MDTPNDKIIEIKAAQQASLVCHWEGILAYFPHRITSAAIESIRRQAELRDRSQPVP